MTPEEFIKNNPFPKNGTEINDKLVAAIQDPSQAAMKQENLKKLLKNNARLVYMIYHQYNYNQELGSIMSFVYEGLAKATDTYDPSVGMPFYHYAVQTIRGLLQNWYNYHNDLIHVPVMKKKDFRHKSGDLQEGIKYEFTDINDYIEHQHCDDLDAVVHIDDESNVLDELDQILIEFERHSTTSDKAREELIVLKLYKDRKTLKEISEITGQNSVKVKKQLDRSIDRLRRFNRKMEDGTLEVQV